VGERDLSLEGGTWETGTADWRKQARAEGGLVCRCTSRCCRAELQGGRSADCSALVFADPGGREGTRSLKLIFLNAGQATSEGIHIVQTGA
jgi:hypothetical protein